MAQGREVYSTGIITQSRYTYHKLPLVFSDIKEVIFITEAVTW
jgi:hypothetical protein